jgi:tetratricopeptide (TPR) repeat protein
MEKGLIRGSATDESLSFHHVLVRSVSYYGTPKSARAALHERTAGWLGEHDMPDELVGYHLEQACHYRSELDPLDERVVELARHAAERLASAASRAVAGEDMRAAVALLVRAEQLLPREDPFRAELLARLGEAMAAVGWPGELAQADAVLEEAIKAARAVGSPRVEWNAVLERSLLRRRIDPATWIEHARREAEDAVRECSRLGYEDELVKGWTVIGMLELDLGHDRAAEEALQRALTYARRSRDERAERLVLGTLGFMAIYGSMHVTDAVRLLDESLELAKARGHPHWQAISYESLAMLVAMRGEFDRARDFLERGRILREDLGVSLAGAAYATAFVARLAGEPAEAERAYRSALRTFEEDGNFGYSSTIAAELAAVLVDQDLNEEAFVFTALSEKMAATHDAEAQALWRGARARALAGRGALEEAERLAREALSIARATDNLLLHAHGLIDLAAVLRVGDRSPEATRLIQDAVQLFEQKGDVVEADQGRALIA